MSLLNATKVTVCSSARQKTIPEEFIHLCQTDLPQSTQLTSLFTLVVAGSRYTGIAEQRATRSDPCSRARTEPASRSLPRPFDVRGFFRVGPCAGLT